MDTEELYPGYNLDMKRAISQIDFEYKWPKYIKSFEKYHSDINHPDFPSHDRKLIIDLMMKWPRVTFYEHCLVINFFTIRQSDDTTFEINPKKDDDVNCGDINILDKIE